MYKNPMEEELQDLKRKYSWVCPTYIVLEEIIKLQPITEWFAGAGYWSYMLEQMGANVVAYTLEPGNQGESTGKTKPWFRIDKCYDDEEIGNNCLLMVRPPLHYVEDVVKKFTGKHIVWVDKKGYLHKPLRLIVKIDSEYSAYFYENKND